MNLQTFDNSLTPKESNGGVALTATQEGQKVCPPVVLVKLNGVTWRALLDTGETACYATGSILNRSKRVPSRTLTHQYRPMWTPLPIASWRRSVSQGTTQKTVRERIKKARREEARERLWANLPKGHSARLVVLVNLSLKHPHGIFRTLSLELKANTLRL